MKFSVLMGRKVERDFEVERVVDDSRAVKGAGCVFVWDTRQGKDSAAIVKDAFDRGAAAVVSDAGLPGVVRSAEPCKLVAQWAAMQWPRQPRVMLGVTGTSGKTSVAWFARQAAALAGHRSASVGTLGVMRKDDDADTEYTGFTSPTALKLHPILDTLAGEKVEVCALEVSSHALVLNRADGVRFKAAGLTNITQDHLDFHEDLAAYHAAKMRLFAEVLPDDGVAVVNVNKPENLPAAALAKQRGCPVLSVGTHSAELAVEVVEASARGLDVRLKFDAVPVAMRLPLIGSFQAENLAVALGLLVGGGLKWAEVAKAAAGVGAVPGRMEVVASKSPQPGVVVDYAHKPDALRRALESLRPVVKEGGKLRVVFGCGGNRDALKRPLMGRIAAELADAVYVTDDNPRKEDPAEIRAQVVAGVKAGGGVALEIGDRREAMAAALGDAGPNDVVLVAGKGHEAGQIVGETVLPFDDRVVARELLG